MKSYQSKEYNLVESVNLDHLPKIEGYDFDKRFKFDKLIDSYKTTGFQAANLSKAISIVKAMQREKAKIFLGCTSNMISSGLREIIKYLVKNKKIDVLVTTAGGVEEDIIKCLKPFVVGSFEADGRTLFEKGVNRTGNIFVPNDRYLYFEKFMNKFFDRIYAEQEKRKRIFDTTELIYELGKEVNSKESILYWASKNKIPVFCPAIIDGAFGDMIYFFKQRQPKFLLDVSNDMNKIVKICLDAEKTGIIALGGGVAKHFILNANIFREGVDYAVYINTGQEFDGSDSGARTEEAVTWGKIKPNALRVKVHADATLVFPLLVAATFAN